MPQLLLRFGSLGLANNNDVGRMRRITPGQVFSGIFGRPFPFDVVVQGRRTADGEIVSSNEPVLVVKRTKRMAMPAPDRDHKVFDGRTELLVDPEQAERYLYITWIYMSIEGDGISSDDVALHLKKDDGTYTYYSRDDSIARTPGIFEDGARYYPNSESGIDIGTEIINIAPGETHVYYYTTEVYLYPKNISVP